MLINKQMDKSSDCFKSNFFWARVLDKLYSWSSFLTLQVLRLGQGFNRFLAAHDDAEVSLKQMVEELMTDTVKADRSAVPDTGVDPDWEYQLSSIFIDTKKGQVNL